MSVMTKKPKSMKVSEIREKAEWLGIVPGKMKKIELIHAVQLAEQNTPCYGTCNGNCDQSGCCFYTDCIKIKS